MPMMPSTAYCSGQVHETAGILYNMVTVAELPIWTSSAAAGCARAAGFLRRHRVFVAALALAVVLRLITMLGYGPAMWFNDSYEYVSVAVHPTAHPIRPTVTGSGCCCSSRSTVSPWSP